MFMDPKQFAEPTHTMDMFREWAGAIANEYLSGGDTPTQGVCKIAQCEELTPSQIQLLSTEVNKLIHTRKYASTKEKYFAADFDLADAKEAISSLQATGGVQKLAYSLPSPKLKKVAVDEFALWGVTPETIDKTASTKRELKETNEKVALVHQKMQDRELMAKHAAASSEYRFIKEARQVVLTNGDSSSERMKVLGFIDSFVKAAGMSFAKESLAKLAYVLGSEGLLYPQHADKAMNYFMAKEADLKAPDEMISPWLQSKVVNGNHPLYITLKTFQDRTNDWKDCSYRENLVKDKAIMLRQRIRAL